VKTTKTTPDGSKTELKKTTHGGSKIPAAVKDQAAVASPAEKPAKVNIVRKPADDGRGRKSREIFNVETDVKIPAMTVVGRNCLYRISFEIFQESELKTKAQPGGSKTPAAAEVKAAVASPAEKSQVCT
jgi:hypothetical protein